MEVFAAKNRDEAVRSRSSSGGVFSALCTQVLKNGGVVYGARYDSEMCVVHARADTREACDSFSGSKYVQSNLGTCFNEVRVDLEACVPVLFSGTPCQIAGLKSYLDVKKVMGDLLTVDLVCHGTPSPRLWADHLRFLEENAGSPVKDFVFRDKQHGWRGLHYRAVTAEGDLVNERVSAFGLLYNSGNMLRPSCHHCPWASISRVGDLTLGDYWGVEKHHPQFDDNAGVSLVLVNSQRGKAALSGLDRELDSIPLGLDEYLQPNLRRPTPRSRDRDSFWRSYHRLGYERAVRKFTSYGMLRRLRKAIGRAVRRLWQ